MACTTDTRRSSPRALSAPTSWESTRWPSPSSRTPSRYTSPRWASSSSPRCVTASTRWLRPVWTRRSLHAMTRVSTASSPRNSSTNTSWSAVVPARSSSAKTSASDVATRGRSTRCASWEAATDLVLLLSLTLRRPKDGAGPPPGYVSSWQPETSPVPPESSGTSIASAAPSATASSVAAHSASRPRTCPRTSKALSPPTVSTPAGSFAQCPARSPLSSFPLLSPWEPTLSSTARSAPSRPTSWAART